MTAVAAYMPLLPAEPMGPWRLVRDGHEVARALYERHYSAKPGRTSKLFVRPGQKMVLLTPDRLALFVWSKQQYSDDGQMGVNCAVFRNEGQQVSSVLIRQAEELAWQRWPGERLFTYVNPHKITSANPGYCFKMAGWRTCGQSAKGYHILEKHPSPMDLHFAPALFQTALTATEHAAIARAWGDIHTLPAFHRGVAAICSARGYQLPQPYAASVVGQTLTIHAAV